MMRFPESEDEKGKKRKIEISSPDRVSEEGEAAGSSPSGGEECAVSGSSETSPDAEAGGGELDLEEGAEEAGELRTKFLRLAADFENYKKRVAREQKEHIERAAGRLAAEILPVLDNLDRAEESARSAAGSELIAEGINVIVGQLKGILKKAGVEEIEAAGQKFDPSRHEAVMVEEAPAEEDQKIIEEYQRGYTYKGKVLRPSRVKVAIFRPPGGQGAE